MMLESSSLPDESLVTLDMNSATSPHHVCRYHQIQSKPWISMQTDLIVIEAFAGASAACMM